MKLSLPCNQYFDDNGKPLSDGRVTVRLHGSDTLADIYTLEGNQYIKAANPYTLEHDGRSPTLYFDAGLVDVQLQDSDLASVDTFSTGLVVDSLAPDSQVDTIAALKQVDPTSNPCVRVLGYYKVGDAPDRIYVWDEGYTVEADGGYIVASSVRSTGRWILLWGCDELPCTIYGVSEGSETNIGRLLTYQQQVGTFRQATAPAVRFMAGIYKSKYDYTTTKTVVMDPGASFEEASIECYELHVSGKPTKGYYGDFSFTSTSAKACQSWFRTFGSFLACGAYDLYFDGDKSVTLAKSVTVSNACLHGGEDTVSITAGSGISLSLVGCTVEQRGTPVIDMGNSRLNLSRMSVSDRQVRGNNVALSSCVLHCGDFQEGYRYLAWARAMGMTEFNLEGQTVTVSSTSDGETFLDGTITSISVTSSVTLRNVRVGTLDAVGSGTVALYDCTVGTWIADSTDIALVAYRSDINCGISVDAVDAVDSRFGDIDAASHLNMAGGSAYKVTCRNAKCDGTEFRGIVWVQDDGSKVTCEFRGCTFHRYQKIATTTRNSNAVVAIDGTWLGNRFLDAEQAIWVDRYSFTGTYGNTEYIDTDPTVHVCKYSGNVGPAVIPDYDQAVSLYTTLNLSREEGSDRLYTIIPLDVFFFGGMVTDRCLQVSTWYDHNAATHEAHMVTNYGTTQTYSCELQKSLDRTNYWRAIVRVTQSNPAQTSAVSSSKPVFADVSMVKILS